MLSGKGQLNPSEQHSQSISFEDAKCQLTEVPPLDAPFGQDFVIAVIEPASAAEHALPLKTAAL